MAAWKNLGTAQPPQVSRHALGDLVEFRERSWTFHRLQEGF